MKTKVISALLVFLCLVVVQVRTAEPDPDSQPPVLSFRPGDEVGDKAKQPDDKTKKPDPDKRALIEYLKTL